MKKRLSGILLVVAFAAYGQQDYPDLLAKFETKYDTNKINRSENIRIAAMSINDVAVQPNKIFSYSVALRPISKAKGYKVGVVYLNGRKVAGVGGGVCQVLTTLYNAALYSNMDILERFNHQFMVPCRQSKRRNHIHPTQRFQIQKQQKNSYLDKSQNRKRNNHR